MTDKQITIDYKTLCENYSKEVGCYYTFDGSCNKEQCFTYRILQLLKAKEQECEELKGRLKYIINENKVLKDCATDEDIDIVALKNYISTLEFSNDQLKDVIKKYEECNKFLVEENGKTYTRLEYKLLRILTEIKEIAEDAKTKVFVDMEEFWKQILQKISECEVENE